MNLPGARKIKANEKQKVTLLNTTTESWHRKQLYPAVMDYLLYVSSGLDKVQHIISPGLSTLTHSQPKSRHPRCIVCPFLDKLGT